MARKIEHDYNHQTDKATVVVKDFRYGVVAKGVAAPHKEDKKFASELTGLTIAEAKADAEFYRKRANAKKKKAEALIAQGKALLESAEYDSEQHEGAKNYLKYYVESKDKFYRKIEEGRNKKSIEFVDLGDLTKGMTEEEIKEVEKEIQESQQEMAQKGVK